MNNFLTTIKSSSLAKKMRIIIGVLFEPTDSKQAQEIAPYGYDAAPVAGLTALYLQTSKRSAPVFAGYVNTNQLAVPGEVRIFATDENGNEKCRIWLFGDRSIEIGGSGPRGHNTRHLTRFEDLNTSLAAWKEELDLQLTAIGAAAGSPYTAPTLDISSAETSKLLIE